jgi:hypothetical protein
VHYPCMVTFPIHLPQCAIIAPLSAGLCSLEDKYIYAEANETPYEEMILSESKRKEKSKMKKGIVEKSREHSLLSDDDDDDDG